MARSALLDATVTELGAFELLVSVIELGSLSGAAARHGVSQPAVSARIRGLERALGVPLVLRTPRGCRATPEGATVARAAEDALDAADSLARVIVEVRSRHQAVVRLAASLTVAEHFLPVWLGNLRSHRPAAAVELHVENSDRVAELVSSGHAELGFVEGPVIRPGLRSEVVATDELAVICSPQHPWARRRRPVEPAELGATPLVVRERGAGGRQTLEWRLAQLGIHLVPPAAEVASPAAICAAVAAGVAPGVVSDLAVAGDIDGGGVCRVQIQGLDLSRQLRAVWCPPDRPASLRWLLSGPARASGSGLL